MLLGEYYNMKTAVFDTSLGLDIWIIIVQRLGYSCEVECLDCVFSTPLFARGPGINSRPGNRLSLLRYQEL
jgi:hypothetical protein